MNVWISLFKFIISFLEYDLPSILFKCFLYKSYLGTMLSMKLSIISFRWSSGDIWYSMLFCFNISNDSLWNV